MILQAFLTELFSTFEFPGNFQFICNTSEMNKKGGILKIKHLNLLCSVIL